MANGPDDLDFELEVSPGNDSIAVSSPEEEGRFEASLRPEALADYVGQDSIRETLGIAIQAAKERGLSLIHI